MDADLSQFVDEAREVLADLEADMHSTPGHFTLD
jgi:hypothetical protein